MLNIVFYVGKNICFSFLNRVQLFETKPSQRFGSKSASVTPNGEEKSRRGRCHACTPKKLKGPNVRFVDEKIYKLVRKPEKTIT